MTVIAFLGLIVFIVIIFSGILSPVFIGKYMYARKIQWIFGSYIVILLLSAILFYLLPMEGLADQSVDRQADVEGSANSFQAFHEAAMEGRLDQVEGVVRTGEWDFSYDEKLIEITSPGGESFAGTLYVERKEVEDGQIEVTHYTTRTVVEGVDLTDEMNPPEVQLSGNRMTLIKPERTEIELARLDNEFTISQFIEEERTEDANYHAMPDVGANAAFMIRIPKNLELDDTTLNIHYVEKSS